MAGVQPKYMMSVLSQNLLPRLTRLLGFYRQLIGLRRTALMAVSSLIVSLLELGGFALLFPYIKLVTDMAFFAQLTERTQGSMLASIFADHFFAVAVTGGALILFFIVKAVVYTLLIGYQARVAGDVNALATKRLIETALYSRYQLFLDEGAVKIAGLSYSNTAHAALLFQCMVTSGNELIFLGVVLASLVLIAPWLTLGVVLILVLLAFGVFYPLSRQVARLGRMARDFEAMRHRFAYALASAIRDIKIMGLEPHFARRNAEIVEGNVGVYSKYQTIASSLRLLVETLMLCSIVVTCVAMVVSRVSLVEFAPLMATLGLIAVRSAPAFSRLVGNFNGFRMSLPLVEDVLDCCDQMARYAQPRGLSGLDFKGDYAASGLCFGYGERLVINQAEIVIPWGRAVAIVGASGSGKSTMLDLLAGLQKPLSGTFTIGGKAFEPFKSLDFSRSVGYVPQQIALLDATLEFNICLEDSPDPGRLAAAIRKAQLDQLMADLPDGVNTMLGDGFSGLSGGQRQRVGIARALYRNPSLLILDEVTSALDEITARAVMDDLNALRGETSLLFVTHDMHLLNADYLYEMVDGRLVLRETGSVLFLQEI